MLVNNLKQFAKERGLVPRILFSQVKELQYLCMAVSGISMDANILPFQKPILISGERQESSIFLAG